MHIEYYVQKEARRQTFAATLYSVLRQVLSLRRSSHKHDGRRKEPTSES